MNSLLPQHSGGLPYWLLLTSAASLFNTIVCFTSNELGRRLYQGPTATDQSTPLSARLFGTWTFLACVIRTYAAYQIESKDIFVIALWTYAIALTHFCTECWVYRTMKMGKELLPSFAIALGTMLWMLVQWEYYVAK
ncbi:ergosterol biosynthesis protein [Tricladium varicosporioides]|nr:ergosterol biosynthesis protein [Hymenoscyphus varicosporioides]